MVGGLSNHHEGLYLGYLPTIETTAYVPAVHRDTVPRPVLARVCGTEQIGSSGHSIYSSQPAGPGMLANFGKFFSNIF